MPRLRFGCYERLKKGNMNRAMKALRDMGFIARQSFMCCQSCAGYALAKEAKALKDAGKEPKGCAFYHKQDAENLRDHKDFYLAFGQIDHYNPDSTVENIGLPTVEVGKIVVETLAKHGVETEWDGSAGTRIKVKFASLK